MSDSPRGIRIGELLVRQGALTAEQVETILEAQRRESRPFGDLAERMFGVTPDAIEQDWIDQYLCFGERAFLEQQRIDVQVLKVINRRQAWQFRMLPLRKKDGELVVATCRDHLQRAVSFAWSRLDDPIHFLIARRPQLEEFLMEHYPWPNALELPTSAKLEDEDEPVPAAAAG